MRLSFTEKTADSSGESIMMTRPCLLAYATASVILFGCASQRPLVYPNEQFKRVGNVAADRDIDACMQRAEQYVASGGRAGEVAERAAVEGGAGAAVGAAAGAAGGAVLGPAGRGAAAGAAGGAAAGITRGLIHGLTRKQNPSPAYKGFVERCLREKGYDPIGWE
jgi:hypothetical protein